MDKIAYYLKVYCLFAVKNIKARAVYTYDHLLGLFFNLIIQAVNIIFLSVLFNQTTDLGSWSKSEVLFLYAFVALVLSISEIFFATLYYLPTHYIRTGELDRILTKPMNAFFGILADRTEIQGIGTLLVALCVMGYSLSHGVSFDLTKSCLLILFVFLSILINLPLFTVAASLGFWIKNFTGGLDVLYTVNEYIKYPFIVFPKLFFNSLIYILPVGFLGYIPAAFLLQKEHGYLIWLMPVFILFLNSLAFAVWRLGLKNYSSTGS